MWRDFVCNVETYQHIISKVKGYLEVIHRDVIQLCGRISVVTGRYLFYWYGGCAWKNNQLRGGLSLSVESKFHSVSFSAVKLKVVGSKPTWIMFIITNHFDSLTSHTQMLHLEIAREMSSKCWNKHNQEPWVRWLWTVVTVCVSQITVVSCYLE